MRVKFNRQWLQCQPGESVLDCLIRHKMEISYSCKNGICHRCMLRASKGDPGPEAQVGLRSSRIEQNFFLPCQCIPKQALEIEGSERDSMRYSSRLLSREKLSADIYRIRLSRPAEFQYRGGQYFSVFHPCGEQRPYSIASLPSSDYLELHIRHFPRGLLSHWLCHEISRQQTLQIGNAGGDCFYQEQEPQRPLLLMATGCGLAPIYAVLHDALKVHSADAIYLYHGSGRPDGLYLVEEMQALAQQQGFHYLASLSRNAPGKAKVLLGAQGRITDLAFSEHQNLRQWSVYLCGGEDFVRQAQRQAFLAGAALTHIHVDAFSLTPSNASVV